MVLPVGGLKEKVLAAHRIGIRTIVLPEDNESDIVDIPPEVRKRLTFKFVKSMDEVIARALLPRSDAAAEVEEVEPALTEEPAVANAVDRPQQDSPPVS